MQKEEFPWNGVPLLQAVTSCFFTDNKVIAQVWKYFKTQEEGKAESDEDN